MRIKSEKEIAERETKIHQGPRGVISEFPAHTTSFMKKAMVQI